MMIRSMKRLAWSGLLAAGIAFATGCEKKYVPPPIDPAAVTGNWIEVVDTKPVNPRMAAAAPKKYLRHLTLNADKTFEFTLRTKSGEPAKKSAKAEGTWEIRSEDGGELLYFEVTNSTFAETGEQSDWAPVSTIGVRQREISGQGLVDALVIEDLAADNIVYMRGN